MRASSFGDDMRRAFGGSRAAQVRELHQGAFSVVEVRHDGLDYGRSDVVPVQDSVLVCLQMRDTTTYDVWEDGKRLDCQPVARGMVNLYDLRRGLVSASAEPIHAVTFTLPIRALDDEHRPRELELGRRRTALLDPVLQGLGMALFPALEEPDRTPRLFVEHVLLALRAHILHRFATVTAPRQTALSSRQLALVREFLEAHLSRNLSLEDVAARCSLSAAHFARAFRRATGMPPYRYLTGLRVARARELLQHSRLPAADIALRCGFADQSHMTKVFRRVLGVTPGSLRPASRRT